jgi:ADP-heptose:LPS heptosyltransferase
VTAPRAVVLRALGLGDLLAVVPALRSLREALPEHRIELATPRRLAALLSRDDLVDAIVDTHGLEDAIPAEPGPDLAVNLHGRGPGSHRLLRALRPRRLVAYANAEAGEDGPPWREGEHQRRRWSRLVATCCAASYDPDRVRLTEPPATAETEPPVVVHPGAGHPARRWPVDRWAEVVRGIGDAPVVVTGDRHEIALAHELAGAAGLPPERVLAGATDIDRLARLVAASRLVVSADTGIAHLAAAYGRPSVTLFGPEPPSAWGPPTSGPHTPIWHGPASAPGPDVHPALLRIGPEEVLAAVRHRLARPPAVPASPA